MVVGTAVATVVRATVSAGIVVITIGGLAAASATVRLSWSMLRSLTATIAARPRTGTAIKAHNETIGHLRFGQAGR
jgi:hypothetical protein